MIESFQMKILVGRTSLATLGQDKNSDNFFLITCRGIVIDYRILVDYRVRNMVRQTEITSHFHSKWENMLSQLKF